MIAGFVILGFLIALSACSKATPKPALVGISSPDAQTTATAAVPAPTATRAPAAPVAKKKTHKKRPAAIVTYSDPKSGVSFRYPRKYELASGDKIEPADASAPAHELVQPGGACGHGAVPRLLIPAPT
jgi:hypothetical protein